MAVPILFGVGVALMLLVAFFVIKACDRPPVRKLTPIEERQFECEPALEKLTPGQGWVKL